MQVNQIELEEINMNAKSIAAVPTTNQAPTDIPVTARGRALRTVDWFLNGTPGKVFYDNPQLRIGNLNIRN